jgi:hypothetical protein
LGEEIRNRQAVIEDADIKAIEILEDELLDSTVIDQAVVEATAGVTASREVTAARLAVLTSAAAS